jgi:hypothetical protein
MVRTDHFSLKYLLDQRLLTILQHAWVSKLFGYQFTVEFKLGRQNTMADALSRHDEEGPAVHSLSIPTFDLFDQFHMEAETLPEVINKRKAIEAGTAGPGWSLLMAWWCTTVAYSCHPRHWHGPRYWRTCMASVMKECKRLSSASALLSPRHATTDWCANISRDVRSVSATRLNIYTQQDYFSRCWFTAQCGLTLQWISSKGFLKSVANR